MYKAFLCLSFIGLQFLSSNAANNTSDNTTVHITTVTQPTSSRLSTPQSTVKVSRTTAFTPETTTQNAEEICTARNNSCNDCLRAPGAKCLWCGEKGCVVYPADKVLPITGACDLKTSKWGVCFVSYFYLLIFMSIFGGLLIIGIVVCCCCCCRKKKNGDSTWLRMQERFERDRQERRERNKERRADRDRRNDEIRRKYGLVKDEQPYQRFDDK